ncbi:hypothetical protein H6G17_31610 [Chroococcidiopsis sp. FACHB-1243]|uniref:hypothetical protein n=1 Tax=Chroococcidiopsis sp. [FACHB-1243] TaxID=2692781 RepID=UPI00177DC3B1|nr:hypothetical protein [Chroococcidiopsis sp. [FACHB-1243]]MBD2309950.1 hypothetical protein [Chroococcidiopsis sp. [FACHB-1243]]
MMVYLSIGFLNIAVGVSKFLCRILVELAYVRANIDRARSRTKNSVKLGELVTTTLALC